MFYSCLHRGSLIECQSDNYDCNSPEKHQFCAPAALENYCLFYNSLWEIDWCAISETRNLEESGAEGFQCADALRNACNFITLPNLG